MRGAYLLLAGLVVLLVVLVLWLAKQLRSGSERSMEGPPLAWQPRNDACFERDAKIFVSVASFRDLDCGKTIEALYKKALNPSRVYVETFEQNAEEAQSRQEESCANGSTDPAWRNRHVRRVVIPARDATGPMTARSRIARDFSKRSSEFDFFWQIDSHTDVCTAWDSLLVKMYEDASASFGSGKIVLSSFPMSQTSSSSGVDFKDHWPAEAVSSRIAGGSINADGFFVPLSEKMSTGEWTPAPQPCVAAGNLFAPADWVLTAPFDVRAHGLFVGEEIALALGSYDAGWTILAMPSCPAYHFYERAGRPKVWNAAEPSASTFGECGPYSRAALRRWMGVATEQDEELLASANQLPRSDPRRQAASWMDRFMPLSEETKRRFPQTIKKKAALADNTKNQ